MKKMLERIRDFIRYEHDDLFKLIGAVLLLAAGIVLICVKSAHAANITDTVTANDSAASSVTTSAPGETLAPTLQPEAAAADPEVETATPEATATPEPTPTPEPEDDAAEQEEAFYYILPAFLGFIAGGSLSRGVLGGVLP